MTFHVRCLKVATNRKDESEGKIESTNFLRHTVAIALDTPEG